MKILYTDGSASPNPGPGGWAVIENGAPVKLGRIKEQTTNIRMEGYALIAALNYAGDEPCEIHTDSQFWIDVLTKWAGGWYRNNWTKRGGKPIENLDVVKNLYRIYLLHKDTAKLIHVDAHTGEPQNELADTWAKNARQGITP